ncbi:hypothetical protein PR048_017941 [Dryococelus australis]|uniref:Uncharacterized protein n=1 Tax=Dryococelus australis TaxID=614101 RepID=A0ABQ9HAY0_9NEOP|nr:hypothetical protein PR048_017941 [Dryococelus australis]
MDPPSGVTNFRHNQADWSVEGTSGILALLYAHLVSPTSALKTLMVSVTKHLRSPRADRKSELRRPPMRPERCKVTVPPIPSLFYTLLDVLLSHLLTSRHGFCVSQWDENCSIASFQSAEKCRCMVQQGGNLSPETSEEKNGGWNRVMNRRGRGKEEETRDGWRQKRYFQQRSHIDRESEITCRAPWATLHTPSHATVSRACSMFHHSLACGHRASISTVCANRNRYRSSPTSHVSWPFKCENKSGSVSQASPVSKGNRRPHVSFTVIALREAPSIKHSGRTSWTKTTGTPALNMHQSRGCEKGARRCIRGRSSHNGHAPSAITHLTLFAVRSASNWRRTKYARGFMTSQTRGRSNPRPFHPGSEANRVRFPVGSLPDFRTRSTGFPRTFVPSPLHTQDLAVKAAAWLKEFCTSEAKNIGSARGDRDMRINSLIACTREALNWRVLLPSITRLYETYSGDPTILQRDTNKTKSGGDYIRRDGLRKQNMKGTSSAKQLHHSHYTTLARHDGSTPKTKVFEKFYVKNTEVPNKRQSEGYTAADRRRGLSTRGELRSSAQSRQVVTGRRLRANSAVKLRLPGTDTRTTSRFQYVIDTDTCPCRRDAGMYTLFTANRVQSPAGSLPDFRLWEPCRTIPPVGGFSRGSSVSSALSFRCCSILTSIKLISCLDHTVKSRPNFFTHFQHRAHHKHAYNADKHSLPHIYCVYYRISDPELGISDPGDIGSGQADQRFKTTVFSQLYCYALAVLHPAQVEVKDSSYMIMVAASQWNVLNDR